MIWAYLSPLFVLAVMIAVFPVLYQSFREDRRLRDRGVDRGYLDAESGQPLSRDSWRGRGDGTHRVA